MPRSVSLAVLLSLFSMIPVQAGAVTGETACQNMVSDGRDNGLGLEGCHCALKVAEATLDPDVLALLLDSWSNGTNNLAALETLPDPGRVARQFAKMKKALKADCPAIKG